MCVCVCLSVCVCVYVCVCVSVSVCVCVWSGRGVCGLSCCPASTCGVAFTQLHLHTHTHTRVCTYTSTHGQTAKFIAMPCAVFHQYHPHAYNFSLPPFPWQDTCTAYESGLHAAPSLPFPPSHASRSSSPAEHRAGHEPGGAQQQGRTGGGRLAKDSACSGAQQDSTQECVVGPTLPRSSGVEVRGHGGENEGEREVFDDAEALRSHVNCAWGLGGHAFDEVLVSPMGDVSLVRAGTAPL